MQKTQEMQVPSLGQEDPRRSRKWQPTPVFLPRKFHEQRNLLGYSHGVAESDTTEHAYMHNEEVRRIEHNQSVLDAFS